MNLFLLRHVLIMFANIKIVLLIFILRINQNCVFSVLQWVTSETDNFVNRIVGFTWSP